MLAPAVMLERTEAKLLAVTASNKRLVSAGPLVSAAVTAAVESAPDSTIAAPINAPDTQPLMSFFLTNFNIPEQKKSRLFYHETWKVTNMELYGTKETI